MEFNSNENAGRTARLPILKCNSKIQIWNQSWRKLKMCCWRKAWCSTQQHRSIPLVKKANQKNALAEAEVKKNVYFLVNGSCLGWFDFTLYFFSKVSVHGESLFHVKDFFCCIHLLRCKPKAGRCPTLINVICSKQMFRLDISQSWCKKKEGVQ